MKLNNMSARCLRRGPFLGWRLYKILFLPTSARPADTIDLPVCCGHVLGRGGFAGPEGVPADVPEPAASRCPGGAHHFRQDGPGSWAELRRDFQELRVPGHQGPDSQANTGVLCHPSGQGLVPLSSVGLSSTGLSGRKEGSVLLTVSLLPSQYLSCLFAFVNFLEARSRLSLCISHNGPVIHS